MIWRTREVREARDMRDREPARQPLQDSQPLLGRRAARVRRLRRDFFEGLAMRVPGVQKSDEENVT